MQGLAAKFGIIKTDANDVRASLRPDQNSLIRSKFMAKRTVTPNCSIVDCDNLARSSKNPLCWKHTYRLKKYGDPSQFQKYKGHGATEEERFWSRVAVTENKDECWEFQGAKLRDGYGSLGFQGASSRAHVVAYKLFYKRNPANLVCHHCDNPPCCNPHHLYDGTAKENAQDMSKRGRVSRGERHPFARITEELVREFKALRQTGMTYIAIAKRFNVAETTVFTAVKGTSWKHVG